MDIGGPAIAGASPQVQYGCRGNMAACSFFTAAKKRIRRRCTVLFTNVCACNAEEQDSFSSGCVLKSASLGRQLVADTAVSSAQRKSWRFPRLRSSLCRQVGILQPLSAVSVGFPNQPGCDGTHNTRNTQTHTTNRHAPTQVALQKVEQHLQQPYAERTPTHTCTHTKHTTHSTTYMLHTRTHRSHHTHTHTHTRARARARTHRHTHRSFCLLPLALCRTHTHHLDKETEQDCADQPGNMPHRTQPLHIDATLLSAYGCVSSLLLCSFCTCTTALPCQLVYVACALCTVCVSVVCVRVNFPHHLFDFPPCSGFHHFYFDCFALKLVFYALC